MKRDTEASRQRLDAQMRQMGLAPPPPPPQQAELPPVAFGQFFGPFDDPVVMLQQVYPQLSECCTYNHLPPEHIDRILARTPTAAQMPQGRADLLSELWTSGTGPAAEHFHSEARIESAPIGFDATLVEISDLRADAAVFDACVPTLTAVAQSFHPDADRCAAVTRQRCDAIQEATQRQAAASRQQQQLSFETGQRAHDAQQESFDRFNHTMAARSTASHRAAADYSEMLGGYQNVVNTRTGESRSVDYYNSPGIVAGLNEQAGSNDEWVASHRRDEQYPLGH